MKLMIKKIVGVCLMVVFSVGTSVTISQAVVPDSTSLETKKKPEEQKLADIFQKIEHHEEEDIHFLKDLKQQIKDLKV